MTSKKSKYRKLKRALVVLGVLILLFITYVEIVNRNSAHMSYKQKVLKAVYPMFMWFNKITGKNTTTMSNEKAKPLVPFSSLRFELNNGDTMPLETLKGKKVLIVNTASNCGFTGQYEGLQALSEQYKDKLVIIGFPANDFKEQEKGDDEEIAQFCKVNFGVIFPLAKKSTVIKNNNQNPVFQWLTDKSKNGWNSEPPSWNFTKFLVNEEGVLTNYFGPGVEPLSAEVKEAVEGN